MTVTQNIEEITNASFRLTTDGVVTQARSWQARLYERLSAPQSDAGYLLATPTGSGRTEAVVIPAMGLRRGGAPRRLFVIGPDGATLDDYVYRLIPYLRTSVYADETPRTVCTDRDEDDRDGRVCLRFLPNGTEETLLEVNPLEADVDLVLTTFSRFQDLFFGSGGVHALPALLPDEEDNRRDLFFFDEAHHYATDAFAGFQRLVEFLFAQDTDVIVGSSTIPPTFSEELSFLEAIRVEPPDGQGAPKLTYRPTGDSLATIASEVNGRREKSRRTIAVVDSFDEAERLHEMISGDAILYHEHQDTEPRRRTYAHLRAIEKQNGSYTLVTTGLALESADLDATFLVTTLCNPDRLILRAGRCDRRGTAPGSEILVVGDSLPSLTYINPTQAADYAGALRDHSGQPFTANVWTALI